MRSVLVCSLIVALGATSTWAGDPVPLNSNAATDSGEDKRPFAATDGAGQWVAVWDSTETLGDTIGTDEDILFALSADDGATWTAPQPLNTNADTDSQGDYLPQVATDGAGHWVAVWMSFGGHGEDWDVLFALSADDGATWTAPQPLNTNADTDSQGDFEPRVATDGAGHWVAVWHSEDPLLHTFWIDTDSDILFALSTDDGATWTAPQPLNTNAAADFGGDWSPQVATDGTGCWITAWESWDPLGDTIGADTDVLFALSTNDGATWTAPQPLNTNAATDYGGDNDVSVATDGAGNWVAVWDSVEDLGGTIGTDWDVLSARSTDGGWSWTAPQVLNTTAATDDGIDDFARVTTDGAGHWLTVWRTGDTLGGTIGADYDTLVARSTDDGATWTAPQLLNENGAADDHNDEYPSVITDGAGHWLAVWFSRDSLGGSIGSDWDVLSSRCTDEDGDGLGFPGSSVCPAADTADCDDSDAYVYPGAPQICDGVNNDCDHVAWPGLDDTNDQDDDIDGYSDCQGDTNDADPDVNPGAAEVCDGKDNNSDGSIDEGCDTVCDDPERSGADVQVNVGSTAHVSSLVWTGSGYGVAWEDTRNGNADIYFARLDSSGIRIGDDVRVTDDPDSSWGPPSLVWTGSQYAVAWRDSRHGDTEIYFARLDASGNKLGGDVRVTNAPAHSADPSLVWAGSEYAVAWHDYREGSGFEIYFARLDPSGDKIGDDVRVTNAPESRGNPSLVWTGSEYAIAWDDLREGNREIYFTRLDSSGREIADDVRVSNDPDRSLLPSLVWTGGEYGLAWHDDRDGAMFEYEVYFARLDSSGNKIGDDVRVTNAPESSETPSLTWTGGEYALAWVGAREGIGQIFFTRVDSSGNTIGNELQLTDSLSYSSRPALVWTGSDYGIAWRKGMPDDSVYLTRLQCCDDLDGDNHSECHECDDGDDHVYPGGPQICDGVNNDCDDPSWPDVPVDEVDGDTDGYAECDGDCDDAEANTYPQAPETNDGADNQCPDDEGAGLVDEISGQSAFNDPGDPDTFCWLDQSGASLYQVARADEPEFSAGCQLEETSETCWTDSEEPGPGETFYYLVRAVSPHAGSWGEDGEHVERSVVCGNETDCANFIDDDGDGLTDCADPDCTAAAECQWSGPWARSFDTGSYEIAYSARETSDGGVIVAGQTRGAGTASYDGWVLKLGGDGAIEWQKAYGGSSDDRFYSIHPTSGGGYIAVGSTESFGAGFDDVWAVKLTADGAVAWQKAYGGSGGEYARGVTEVESGYVVAGSTWSFGAGGYDAWVLKLSDSGAVTWESTYGGTGNEFGWSVTCLAGGNCATAGYTNSVGAGSDDAWILGLDISNGSVVWEKAYGGVDYELLSTIRPTQDGGLIAAGETFSFGAGGYDLWVLKLFANGSVDWEKTLGGSDWERMATGASDVITQTSDGGYAVVGSLYESAGRDDVGFVKLTSSGAIEWQKIYHGLNDEDGLFVEQTADGGYIAGGKASSFGAGDDAWVLRLESDGDIGEACSLITDGSFTAQDSSAVVTLTSMGGSASSATVTTTNASPIDTSAVSDEQCSGD